MARRFVYVWEYGDNLGHLLSFLPIAHVLAGAGWKGHFFIPAQTYSAEICKKIIKNSAFSVYFNPYNRKRTKEDRPARDHFDLLLRMDCFVDKKTARFHARSWHRIFESIEPAIVFGDYAPFALLCARALGLVAIAVDTGYLYPDASLELPVFADDPEYDIADCKRRLLELGNDAVSQFSSYKLPQADTLLTHDDVLWLNFPSLSPFTHSKETDFLGGLTSFPGSDCLAIPQWPLYDNDKPKVFAYLHTNYAQAFRVLKVICEKPELNVIVVAPNAHPNLLAGQSFKHVKLYCEAVNLESIIRDVDLVVSHGGAGLISQSLWAGAPMLLAPCHQEQKLNSMRVSQLKCAITLAELGYKEQTIALAIDELLLDPKYKAHARSFKHQNTPADYTAIASTLHKRYARLGRAVKKPYANPFLRMSDLEVVFLSYDEPNADENYRRLTSLIPNAKRVHGVRGIDAAHKEAARSVDGRRFVLIDGDNYVYEKFFQGSTEIPVNLEGAIWQWCSENSVNGLVYAGGGIRVWVKDELLGMSTHEAQMDNSGAQKLDFWMHPGHFVFSGIFSRTVINSTGLQAFRAGFREGVKYTVDNIELIKSMSPNASVSVLLRRLGVWMSVGLDVENGAWAMLGARYGFLYAYQNHPDPDAIALINDYEWLYERYQAIAAKDSGDCLSDYDFLEHELKCTRDLVTPIFPIPIINMNSGESIRFKAAMKEQRLESEHMFSLLRNGGRQL